jgi:hypothetical protein
MHGIPTDLYPDTEKGMKALQEDIEQQNYSGVLAQPPHYMLHPDKRIGKAASSIVIALHTQSEAEQLKCNRVNVNLSPRNVTDYFTARSTDQCRHCQPLGHRHATWKADTGPMCGFCTGYHATDKHACPQCPMCIGKSCDHIAYRCSNCIAAGNLDVAHAAFNPRCPVKSKAIRDAWQKNIDTAATATTAADVMILSNE